MGREFIGECPIYGEDPELESYESELAVRFIKRESGKPPRSVDVQLGYEDSEYGGIPAIVVIWDDYERAIPRITSRNASMHLNVLSFQRKSTNKGAKGQTCFVKSMLTWKTGSSRIEPRFHFRETGISLEPSWPTVLMV